MHWPTHLLLRRESVRSPGCKPEVAKDKHDSLLIDGMPQAERFERMQRVVLRVRLLGERWRRRVVRIVEDRRRLGLGLLLQLELVRLGWCRPGLVGEYDGLRLERVAMLHNPRCQYQGSSFLSLPHTFSFHRCLYHSSRNTHNLHVREPALPSSPRYKPVRTRAVHLNLRRLLLLIALLLLLHR